MNLKNNLSTKEKLALNGTVQENLAALDTMYNAFLETEWANCRDTRIAVLNLHTILKDSL